MSGRKCVFALYSFAAMSAVFALSATDSLAQSRGWCVKLSQFYDSAPMYPPNCNPEEGNGCIPWKVLLHSDGEIGVADDDRGDEYWYLDNNNEDNPKYGWVERERLTRDFRCRGNYRKKND